MKKSKGGYRGRAGRPCGTGKYKEKTAPIRIPESLLPAVKEMLNRHLICGDKSNNLTLKVLDTVG